MSAGERASTLATRAVCNCINTWLCIIISKVIGHLVPVICIAFFSCIHGGFLLKNLSCYLQAAYSVIALRSVLPEMDWIFNKILKGTFWIVTHFLCIGRSCAAYKSVHRNLYFLLGSYVLIRRSHCTNAHTHTEQHARAHTHTCSKRS
jgi:hypothetical protein